jgi:hypothetical protein
MKMKSFIVEKIHTNDNVSDIMAKLLLKERFEFYRRQVDLVKPTKLKLTK